MGNFFVAPLFDKDDEAPLVWHVLVAVAGLWVLCHILDFIVLKVKQVGNRASARSMLQERNQKVYEFDKVDP